jgi:hypothetical protein
MSVPEAHYVDPGSQALIFPRSAAAVVAEENQHLKQLLSAIVDVLPKTQRDKLPTELLEKINGNPTA